VAVCKAKAVIGRWGDFFSSHWTIKASFEIGEPLSIEERVWRCLTYWTWNHIGSAELTWSIVDPWSRFPLGLRMKTSVERRGFRGNDRAREMIDEVLRLGMAYVLPTYPGTRGWVELRERIETLPHCSSWSSYRWAGICRHMLDYDISPPDLGTGGSRKTAGPIAGLVAITGTDWKHCAQPRTQRDLWSKLLAEGVPFKSMEQMESSLCDFSRMIRGRYYVASIVDVQMGEILSPESIMWRARPLAYPPEVLGEVSGWTGPRAHLYPHFQNTGAVLVPEQLLEMTPAPDQHSFADALTEHMESP
jgi:hypothetical protein